MSHCYFLIVLGCEGKQRNNLFMMNTYFLNFNLNAKKQNLLIDYSQIIKYANNI